MSDALITKHAVPMFDREHMPQHVKDYLLSLAMKGKDVQEVIISTLEKEAAKKGFKPNKPSAA
jgi:hypothetical protein